ncbi:Uncharacterised protein [Chlamydia trachomatis]|nr:Uncharacterised protein [Chlamydia trachomatis]
MNSLLRLQREMSLLFHKKKYQGKISLILLPSTEDPFISGWILCLLSHRVLVHLLQTSIGGLASLGEPLYPLALDTK